MAVEPIPGTSFDECYAHLDDEAGAQGPSAVLDLRTKAIKYALVNTSIARRQTLKGNESESARPRKSTT